MDKTDFAAARKALGLTQDQLGQRLGLTRRHVRNMETGKTPIRQVYATLIASAVKEASAPGASGLNERTKT
jgi:transcriptional regulator with XRE-family HTH domain